MKAESALPLKTAKKYTKMFDRSLYDEEFNSRRPKGSKRNKDVYRIYLHTKGNADVKIPKPIQKAIEDSPFTLEDYLSGTLFEHRTYKGKDGATRNNKVETTMFKV